MHDDISYPRDSGFNGFFNAVAYAVGIIDMHTGIDLYM